MLRPYINITIQQITPFTYKTVGGIDLKIERTTKFNIDFVNECEISHSWENHTDTCTIKLPKNVQLVQNEYLFKQNGTYNVILGSSSDNFNANRGDNEAPPLLMRGDMVTVNYGYMAQNRQNTTINVTPAIPPYVGYITKVTSGVPIEIECEDQFYLLKRTPFGVSVWNGNLLALCNNIISLVNAQFADQNSIYPTLQMSTLPNSITAGFSLGHLVTGSKTCGEVLANLRQQFHLESFFVGNILNFGFPIYNEGTANKQNFGTTANIPVFEFQNNILPDHSLEYVNKADIQLSALVRCQVINETSGSTYDGATKTKKTSLRIFIYWDIVSQSFQYLQLTPGQPVPENEDGERHEFVYPLAPLQPAPTLATLVSFGKSQIEKYYYTGFRGSFTSFGFPFVNWNDNIVLMDDVFADRNGQYKVKKVVTKIGMGGIRQEIFLDFKYNILVPIPTSEIYLG